MRSSFDARPPVFARIALRRTKPILLLRRTQFSRLPFQRRLVPEGVTQ
jgi:hypothetical protein